MKIALVCRVYVTHRPGGMPYVVEDRARALTAEGHEVHILTTGGAVGNSDVYHLDCEPQVYSHKFADQCERHCRIWQPDLVHFDSFNLHYPWWLNLPERVKTACTLHGFAWGSLFTEWNLFCLGRGGYPKLDPDKFLQERQALDGFKTVIAISRHELWMLRDLFGLFYVKLVYNPIHPCFFEVPVTILPTERRFLCTAISSQGTRLFDLAEEAARIAGVPLDNISDKPREQMPAVYDSVSALVVPTAYSQGYDLTIAEALARRRPVIVSSTGSYLREAEVNPAFVVVRLGSVDALSRAMSGPLPPVQGHPAHKHRPEVHTRQWLNAIV